MSEDYEKLEGKDDGDSGQADPTDEGFYVRRVQPCLVEFFGTAVFVFIGTMSAQNELLLSVAVAHGLTITLLILAFGNISGGHFNPAVSLGALIAGGLNWLLAVGYWVCQLTGGIVGAAITRVCLNYVSTRLGPSTETEYIRIVGGLPLVNEVSVFQGIMTEFILTLILVTTVLMSGIDSKTKSPLAGLAIGFAVAVDILVGGPITGAAMNPARALGPALMVTTLRPDVSTMVWSKQYIYWVGPLLAAVVSGIFYRLLFAADDKRIMFKKKQ